MISKWLSPFRSESPRSRWVDPSLYHLTLRFFGELPVDHVDALISGLSGVQARCCPVSFSRIGTFGTPPRVLYLGLESGGERLQELYNEYANDVRAFGLREESRPYSPHLTLARARDRRASIRWPQGSFLCQCTLDRVVLFESRTASGGPKYIPLQTVRLREDQV